MMPVRYCCQRLTESLLYQLIKLLNKKIDGYKETTSENLVCNFKDVKNNRVYNYGNVTIKRINNLIKQSNAKLRVSFHQGNPGLS